MRVAVGWWLLYAGLDRLFNWPFDASWFVAGAASTSLGPVVSPFIEGILLTFTNFAVPIGRLLIDLGLILGAMTPMAAFFGTFLLMFFYVLNREGGDWSHGVITGEFLDISCGMIVTLGPAEFSASTATWSRRTSSRTTRDRRNGLTAPPPRPRRGRSMSFPVVPLEHTDTVMVTPTEWCR